MSRRSSHNFWNNLLLSDLVNTFIGPYRRIKCLEDDSGYRYYRNGCLLLEQLDIEHPAYQYIISISSDFRKKYGERAADDLLYFIHSWSRVIVDLIDMGIPMTSLTFHMKAVIIDCIHHTETRKFDISKVMEVSKKFVLDSANSFCSIRSKDVSSSASYDLFRNKTVTENCLPSMCVIDRFVVNGHATETEDKTNDKRSDIESPIEELIEEMGYGHKFKGEEVRTSSNYSCTVDEETIQMINLEMKSIKREMDDDDDYDDTSWFFDSVASDVNTSFVNPENITEQSGERKAETDAVEMANEEGNSDDPGAVLSDIVKLKSDIENDLKILKETKERMKQFTRKVKDSTGNQTQEMDRYCQEIDADFDSCSHSSDSEFSDCFKDLDQKESSVGENDIWVRNKLDQHTEDEEFRTVQFEFADTAGKETSKLHVNTSVGHFSKDRQSTDVLKCLPSKIQVSQANCSIGIELQMCQKEYVKTQEMLRSNEIIVENKYREANDILESKENKSIESLSLIKHVKSNDTIKVKSQNSLTGHQDCLEQARCYNTYRQKLGKKSGNESRIQEINSLLDSYRGDSNTDVYKDRMSSLKFHSRHFQGEKVEADKKSDNIDQVNLDDSDKQGNNVNSEADNIDQVNLDESDKQENNVNSEWDNTALLKARTFVGSSTGLSNLNILAIEPVQSSSSHPGNPATADKHLKEFSKLSSNCFDLNSINSMLKDIKTLSVRVKEPGINGVQKETDEGGNISNKNNQSEIPHDGTCNPQDLEVKNKLSQGKGESTFSEFVSINSHSLQGSRMSNIFLRSRHMNREEEITDASKCYETADAPESTEEEKISMNGITLNKTPENITRQDQVRNELGTFKGETSDKMLKEIVRQMVMGVNYDGDEDISETVCDVILKQSRNGKPRLNIETIDCYSRTGVKECPQVIDGVVVSVSMDTLSSIQKLHGMQCRALLVNGDLTVSFRHKGYMPLKVKEFLTFDGLTSSRTLSKSERWLKDIIHILEKLSINVLLVKGSLSGELVSACESLDIVVLDAIPYKQLVRLSEAAQIDMVTYTPLATEENVCTGMFVSPLQQNWCDKMTSWTSKQEVVISLDHNNPQTVILCGITPMLTDLKEQELWDCLHHVTSVLHHGGLLSGAGQTKEDGGLVSGAGQTEEACVRHLEENLEILRKDQTLMWSHEHQYKQMVLESVISSLRSYFTVFKDSELISDLTVEGYNSKIETWKTALDLAITLNSIDSVITTGLTEDLAHIL